MSRRAVRDSATVSGGWARCGRVAAAMRAWGCRSWIAALSTVLAEKKRGCAAANRGRVAGGRRPRQGLEPRNRRSRPGKSGREGAVEQRPGCSRLRRSTPALPVEVLADFAARARCSGDRGRGSPRRRRRKAGGRSTRRGGEAEHASRFETGRPPAGRAWPRHCADAVDAGGRCVPAGRCGSCRPVRLSAVVVAGNQSGIVARSVPRASRRRTQASKRGHSARMVGSPMRRAMSSPWSILS